jgi:hypothetical protein
MAPPPRLAVHFSQLAIIASLVSLAIGYAERGGQRTILGTHRYDERADRDGCCLKRTQVGMVLGVSPPKPRKIHHDRR